MDLKLILVDKINQKETMPRYSIPQPLFIPENLIQFIDGLHAVHGKSIKIQLLVKASVYPVLSQHHVVLRRNLPSAHIGADLLPLFFHQYQEGCKAFKYFGQHKGHSHPRNGPEDTVVDLHHAFLRIRHQHQKELIGYQ